MSGQDVLFTRDGHSGVVTLNRPEALNAVTLGMVREIHPSIEALGRRSGHPPCADRSGRRQGVQRRGDIRALYALGPGRGPMTFLAFYREEYQLDTFHQALSQALCRAARRHHHGRRRRRVDPRQPPGRR